MAEKRDESSGVLQTVAMEQKSQLLVDSNPEVTKQMVSTSAVHRMNDPNDLVTLAQYVQTADDFTKATVGGKLELIADQIKALQDQARQVLESAKRDVELNHAKCNFRRIPGKVYHLFRKESDGSTYFSMLSPEEWGDRATDTFIDSYRLEYDMSWTPLSKIQERDERRRLDAQLLGVDREQAKQLSLEC
ncbi:hypothetical protein PTSG_01356 [Salpingoeca rosetta]|uniref:Uncharacterized protein n=1 Tax=Salpingoeca rosetta (strain ATCC 50818 / BSB-021) TaxID=946362 RepID=F2U040_SALR5|nr:uncharacterized protein PTSG_01356 [Salpingoeca rosetta]EGD80768.1 hypothetical protein PTSG_01356 [Salpingoeca rosetta]|eukprot:XP_004997329.1 hypothetical protein PTSG_01356 [Salpingoeca rosetta]